MFSPPSVQEGGEVKVVLLVADPTLWCLRPFFYMQQKYAPWMRGYVAGFSSPKFEIPADWQFVSLGAFEDYPINKWSNAVRNLIGNAGFVEERFILMLEDYFILRKVDELGIRQLGAYMAQHSDIAKIDLTTDRLYAGDMRDYVAYEQFDLIISDPNSAYNTSLLAAIWDKQSFLDILIDDETPWQFELEGSTRWKNYALDTYKKILGTRQFPIRHTVAIRNGAIDYECLWQEPHPNKINKMDLDALGKLGILTPRDY